MVYSASFVNSGMYHMMETAMESIVHNYTHHETNQAYCSLQRDRGVQLAIYHNKGFGANPNREKIFYIFSICNVG